MCSRAIAFVCSLMAGPALAAPPLSSTVDNAAPSVTDRPGEYRLEGGKVWGFAFGLGMFGGAAVGLGLGFGLGRRDLREYGGKLDDVLARVREQGYRTPSDDWLASRYDQMLDHARDLMIATGVTAAVLAGVGAGLLTWSLKRRPSGQAHLNPYGGPQGVGFSIVGRF